MSEFCETAGHDYKNKTLTVYTIPERIHDPDFPVVLGVGAFIFLVITTIVSTVMMNPMPIIGGVVTFLIAMCIYTKSRFQKEHTAYVCNRCGKIIKI